LNEAALRQKNPKLFRRINWVITLSALLVGVGIGVGVGLLIAPASGEETHSEFGDKIRERTTWKKPQGATGTYGE
jgi:hypothetical protein